MGFKRANEGRREVALATLETIKTKVEDYKATIPRAVLEARKEGASWQQIGDALGVKRQTAWEQYHNVKEGEVGALAANPED